MKKYPGFVLLPVLILWLSVVSCTPADPTQQQSAIGQQDGSVRVFDLSIVSAPGQFQLEISYTLP